MANYVSYNQILTIVRSISHKFDLLGGAFVIKGTKTFATLPEPGAKTVGFVYNVSDAFTTTATFVEGAGNNYPAGTNVVIVNNATRTFTAVSAETIAALETSPKDARYYELTDPTNGEYVLTSDATPVSEKTYYTVVDGTPAYKYDVLAGFIDVTAITDRIDDVVGSIAPEFSASTAYEAGETVMYNGSLYKFTSNHSAGAWDDNDAEPATVSSLIDNAEPESLDTNQMNTLLGLL